MQYTINWAIQEFEKHNSLKYLFFWGQQPRKDGQVSKSCFSQWWEEVFVVDGITYRSAEHWMMAEKARLFQDEEILQEILAAISPAEAKKLGRSVRNFDPQTWDAHKFEIVKQGNLHKFAQSDALRSFLLTTHKRIIVEASPYDRIWGIGMSERDPGVENPHNWQGENLLGFALMEARQKLSENE